MPLQATSGAASYDGFGGGVAAVPNFIEDVFQTWLYTGNGATQTITNGIDLSTKGGLVWFKDRTSGVFSHILQDTINGSGKKLNSNTADALANDSNAIQSFLSTGFSIGSSAGLNTNTDNIVSWTFRKQPKFFDVVTWSGDGTGNRAIPHSLGSMPSFFPIKQTNGGESWWTYQRSVTSPNANWWRNYGILNGTNAFDDWGDNSGLYQAPDANNLYIGSWYNASGKTYVAYLFAHNAGGFGLTGTDNVISCGTFTTTSGGVATVNLGYEPQWILFKSSASSDNWSMFDNMRGWPAPGSTAGRQQLKANTSEAEGSNNFVSTTSTGFVTQNLLSPDTFIYIAIRRGPMKVPTVGTSVFTPSTRAGTGAVATTSNLSFPPDMVWSKGRDNGGTNSGDFDRLRGATKQLSLNQQDAETTASTSLTGFDVMTGYAAGADATQLTINATGYNYANWQFRRAPGFFDEVCDTGTGSTHTIAHNLGVVPELMIRKSRSQSSTSWYCYVASEGASRRGFLNYDFAWGGPDNSIWGGTTPTSTVFTVGADGNVNNNTSTYVTYLFATCAGVSKVGTYTGTGTTQVINCGFTAGARFVLIKRTDSTGAWYVWDSARGIIAGNDPYLLLNSTAAEVTNTDFVDTAATGFEISSTAPAAINASGGSFIFLAIS